MGNTVRIGASAVPGAAYQITQPDVDRYLLAGNNLSDISDKALARTNLGVTGGGAWGTITGLITDQADLVAALGLKAPLASPIFTGLVSMRDLQFNTAGAALPLAEGKMSWDTSAGTMLIGMPGGNVSLQIGQENLIRVTNRTGNPMTNGQVVYISGSQGNRPKVALARANTHNTACTIVMLTENINDNGTGYATTFGIVRDINTLGYIEGDEIYLSPTTPGAFTKTKPSAPNFRVEIGVVLVVSATVGQILFRPGNALSLSDLSDVNGTTPDVDHNLLVWNNTTKAWDATGNTAAFMASTMNTGKLLGRASVGFGSIEEITLTAAGRALLDDASAADQRTSLGLGTMATAAAADYALKTAPVFITSFGIGTSGWTFEMSGNDLVLKYNNSIMYKFNTTGSLYMEGDAYFGQAL